MARGKRKQTPGAAAPSRGRYVGTGNGPAFQPIDIGHPDYVAVIEPDTAFWALVRREKLADAALSGDLLKSFRKKASLFAKEIQTLRAGLKPSAVYFNPTERCNLNCAYCYIPEGMRRKGRHMSPENLLHSLAILQRYFRDTLAKGVLPQIVFHGAEPLLNREALFAGIGGTATTSVSASRPMPRCWTIRPSSSSATTRSASAFPWTRPRLLLPTARGATGKGRGSLHRSCGRWSGSRAIRPGA